MVCGEGMHPQSRVVLWVRLRSIVRACLLAGGSGQLGKPGLMTEPGQHHYLSSGLVGQSPFGRTELSAVDCGSRVWF